MPRNLTAADRKSLIRLASTLPAGSDERKAILNGLAKTSRKDARKAVREAFAELKKTRMAYIDMIQARTEDLIVQAVEAERSGDRSKLWDPSDLDANAEDLMEKAKRLIGPDGPGRGIDRMSRSEMDGVFLGALYKR
jgi:hypothetical protein